MEKTVYREMSAIEDVHWWFVARRVILNKILLGLDLPNEADILDAGCGTGGNLAMLARFGRVYAMEMDAFARNYAIKRGHGLVSPGYLPGNIPFTDRNFDLV